MDKEVIFKDNLQKIFGDRPFSKADATFVEVASKDKDTDTETIEEDKSEAIINDTKE